MDKIVQNLDSDIKISSWERAFQKLLTEGDTPSRAFWKGENVCEMEEKG